MNILSLLKTSTRIAAAVVATAVAAISKPLIFWQFHFFDCFLFCSFNVKLMEFVIVKFINERS